MMNVDGSAMFVTTDAITIPGQIEGAPAHIDSIGTRADEKTFKRMRLTLKSAYRAVHNRMHQAGNYHTHSPEMNHHKNE